MTQQTRSTAFASASTVACSITLPFVCTSCHEETRSSRCPTTCAGCGGDDFSLARSPESEVTFVADPGHGWLLVTPERFRAYGLKAAQISPYSYRAPDSSVFALEEDCDAEVFLAAFRDHHGVMPFIVERFEDPCGIRGWPQFPSTRR